MSTIPKDAAASSVATFTSARRNPMYMFIGLLMLFSITGFILMPMSRSIEIIGNASFAATFFSYAQNDLIRLRLIAIASLVLGLTYNTYVHLHMPPGQGIALVIFWLSVFLVQNLYKAAQEISRSIEAPLSPNEKHLLSVAFPSMHTKDWLALSEAAIKRTLPFGAVIIQSGSQTSSISLLTSGQADEVRMDGLPTLERHSGTFWGELTWTLGRDAFNKSPCDVTITSAEAEIWQWDYETLNRLTKNNPRLLSALRDGFLRSACFKHGLLQKRGNDCPPPWDGDLAVV